MKLFLSDLGRKLSLRVLAVVCVLSLVVCFGTMLFTHPTAITTPIAFGSLALMVISGVAAASKLEA